MVGDIIADSRATSPGIRILVQRRRDKRAAKRLLRKLLKRQMRSPRVMITDKLASYAARVAIRSPMPTANRLHLAKRH